MNNKEVRQMIIDLLDDEHGINNEGYTQLIPLACMSGNEDVVKSAMEINGRWFIGETDAEDLRQANLVMPLVTPTP